jgi:hypothetical protein
MVRSWLSMLTLSTWLLAWSALPGCQLGFYNGDDDDDTLLDDDDDDDNGDDDDNDDDTTPTGNVSVSAVSPNAGGITGGFDATVYGGNFTSPSDTTIYFGTSVATVTGCESTQCDVIVPPAASEGTVTVTVENSNGVGVREDAFTYMEDVSDLVTYTVEMLRFEYLYPDIYTKPPLSYVQSTAYFFTPMEIDVYSSLSWGNLLPAPGNCITYTWPTDLGSTSVSPYDAGSAVTLTNGGTSLVLPAEQHYYTYDSTNLADYQAGSWSMTVPGGGDLAGESLPGVMTTPGVVHANPPLDPGQIPWSTITSQGLVMSIQGGCSPATLQVNVHDADGAYWESILCHYTNGANMVVPAAMLQPYSGAVGLVVEPECYTVTETVAASGAKVVGIGRSVASGILMIQ